MSTTTTVCVIADGASELVTEAASRAANVGGETSPLATDDLVAQSSELADTWSRARRRRAVYTLVDADPLATVVDHWSRRLAGEPVDLDTAVALVGDGPMPDYYLVSAELDAPRVHWYLGLLAELAASRVEAVPATADGIITALRHRRSGPGLPSCREVALRAQDYVPMGFTAPRPIP
jgi:hypothetical protein